MSKLYCYQSSSYALQFDLTKYDTSLMYIMSIFFRNYFVNDRFNILNDVAEWNIISRCDNINDIWNTKYFSFEECCRKRTDEIIDLVGDSNIFVLSSGGVDSTCVICSFLMNERLNKNNFYVLYNDRTVMEYPSLIQYLKKNGVKCIDTNMSYEVISSYSTKGYIVSGFGGDEIASSCSNGFVNWKDWFRGYCVHENPIKSYKFCDKWISQIEDYSNKLNIPINTNSEMITLMSYGLHYSTVLYQSSIVWDNPYSHIPFFDTLYFNKHHLIFRKNLRFSSVLSSKDYKTEFKRVIYKCIKDEYYFLNKHKSMSYMHTYMLPLGFYWFDDNGCHKLPFVSKETLYEIIIKYIKPEYREFLYLDDTPHKRWTAWRNGTLKERGLNVY